MYRGLGHFLPPRAQLRDGPNRPEIRLIGCPHASSLSSAKNAIWRNDLLLIRPPANRRNMRRGGIDPPGWSEGGRSSRCPSPGEGNQHRRPDCKKYPVRQPGRSNSHAFPGVSSTAQSKAPCVYAITPITPGRRSNSRAFGRHTPLLSESPASGRRADHPA